MGRAAFLGTMIARQKDAHCKGYYFEASWYAHGIFEDRTKRICEHILPTGEHPPDSLAEKIQIIKTCCDADKTKVVDGKPVRGTRKEGGNKIKIPKHPIYQTIDKGFLENLHVWREDRNQLVHELATGKFNISQIDRDKKDLSTRGDKLVKEILATTMRIKKRIQ